MEQEQTIRKRAQDLAHVAYDRTIVTFSSFLSLYELNIVKTQVPHDGMITFELSGGYEQAERQMIAFIPDALSYDWTYPIKILHIRPKAVRYAEPCTHRDVLGTMISLGIDRSRIGDILPGDNKDFYVFVSDQISDFLCEELTRIRHNEVHAEIVDALPDTATPKRISISGTVTSVRLDSMIALAFSNSRSSMLSFIESGKVYVDGKLVTSNGYQLQEGDIVSVRGKGKFCYVRTTSRTKKNKYSVELERYTS